MYKYTFRIALSETAMKFGKIAEQIGDEQNSTDIYLSITLKAGSMDSLPAELPVYGGSPLGIDYFKAWTFGKTPRYDIGFDPNGMFAPIHLYWLLVQHREDFLFEIATDDPADFDDYQEEYPEGIDVPDSRIVF